MTTTFVAVVLQPLITTTDRRHTNTSKEEDEDEGDLDSSWSQYFKNPLNWWDERSGKVNLRLPGFKHQFWKKSLWIHGWFNPPCVQQVGLVIVSSNHSQQKQKIQENIALVALLKSCAEQRDLHEGRRIHVDILTRGLLEKDSYVGSALISMYAKCGALLEAQQVFDELPTRNVVTWTALIAGYAQHGHGEEALNYFEQMQCEGLSPNAVTFVCIVNACGSLGAAEKGYEIHAQIVREGWLEKSIVLGNALVDMFAKCGALPKAQQVFDHLPVRDVVTWTALIAGYAQHGYGEEAVNCFERMQHEGISPNAITYTYVINACGSIQAAEKGNDIHADIAREGLLEKSIVLGNALVDMYAKCGALPKAQQVFDELPSRNVVTWTALIAGYAQNGHGEEALNCFEQMQHDGFSPNITTFACVIKACASIGAAERGEVIHAEIARKGLLGKNVLLGNALVDMYAKCSALLKAQQVFDELAVRDTVTWNVLIAAYAHHGHGQEAVKWFERMQHEGFSPDVVTFTCVLKACGSIAAAEKGCEIHAEVVKKRLLEKDIVLGNALVHMYAKCGVLLKAKQVFDELPSRNVDTWNALVSGYAQHKCGEEALNCYKQMQCEGVSPDEVTFACVLNTCGSMGAADKGKEIHAGIARGGLLEKSIVLGNALVDMYAKCGALSRAQQVFDELQVRDVVTWTTLIGGYTQHGQDEEALVSFELMQQEGFTPNAVTFSVVLIACCHSGLVDAGQKHFATMRTHYGIVPTLQHCTCMVDLFGRAGHFDKALQIIKEMSSPHLTLWSALLGACKKWGNVNLGRLAFEHVVQLDEKAASAYVCMSEIYAANGMQEYANHIEAMGYKKSMEEVNMMFSMKLLEMPICFIPRQKISVHQYQEAASLLVLICIVPLVHELLIAIFVSLAVAG